MNRREFVGYSIPSVTNVYFAGNRWSQINIQFFVFEFSYAQNKVNELTMSMTRHLLLEKILEERVHNGQKGITAVNDAI